MEAVLKVEGLKKSYGDLLVIDGLNLELKRGESLFLFGPSGCGKTTFLKIVAGLIEDFEGKVERNFRKVGFVFQDPRLIPWLTVKENLLFVYEDERRVKEVIEIAGLQGFEDSFPRQLSGGMKQRVNLARAILSRPDLLILDEPFSSLDIHIKHRLMKDILRIKRRCKASLLGVTHDPKEASIMASKVVVLSKRPARILTVLEVSDSSEAEKKLIQIALENF